MTSIAGQIAGMHPTKQILNQTINLRCKVSLCSRPTHAPQTVEVRSHYVTGYMFGSSQASEAANNADPTQPRQPLLDCVWIILLPRLNIYPPSSGSSARFLVYQYKVLLEDTDIPHNWVYADLDTSSGCLKLKFARNALCWQPPSKALRNPAPMRIGSLSHLGYMGHLLAPFTNKPRRVVDAVLGIIHHVATCAHVIAVQPGHQLLHAAVAPLALTCPPPVLAFSRSSQSYCGSQSKQGIAPSRSPFAYTICILSKMKRCSTHCGAC